MPIVKRDALVDVLTEWCDGTDDHKEEIIDIYNEYMGTHYGYDVAYCAITATAAAIVATDGNPQTMEMFPESASCGDLINQAVKNKTWVENDAYVPDPGDYIIYDWDSSGYGDEQEGHDHVGIVQKVENGRIYVLEGNMGDAGVCSVRDIPINYSKTRGYILPKYSDRDYNKPVPPISNNSSKNPSNARVRGGSSTASPRQIYAAVGNRAYNGSKVRFRGSRNSFGITSASVNNFLKRGVYSIWYDITLGSLHLSSTSTNNIFVSLEYNKNGSGQANTFTLNLAFVPKPGSDPNAIDKALVLSDIDTKGCKVKMQYGYTNGPSSPKYEGLALDYSIEIRDGILYYTITGYSGIVTEVVERRSYDEIGDVEDEKTWDQPTSVAYEAFEEAFRGTEYTVEYKVDHPDARTHIPARYDLTVFEYVNELLLSACAENEIDSDDIKHKVLYSYYIDDSRKAVVISSFSPSESDANNKSTYTFNWMSDENNMILDFRPDFKGSIALAVNIARERSTTKYVVDQHGQLQPVNSLEDINTEDRETSKRKSAAIWAEAIQTPYTATLTVVGVPCDAPIGEVVEINPLIYGVKHHTSGNYMITGTRDILDANGYQTTVNLMKVMQ